MSNHDENNNNVSTITDVELNSESSTQVSNDNVVVNNDGSNELFFEKFNNTKKDYKRQQLEKVKKEINKRNKTLSFDRRLEDNRFLTKVYIMIGIVIFFVLSISITVFTINIMFYNGDVDNYLNNNTWYGIANAINKWYLDMNRAVVIMSGIAFSLIPLPFLFLLTTWFVGMNQIFRSWKFILTVFIFIGLASLLVIITIPMFSIIYDNHTNLNFVSL